MTNGDGDHLPRTRPPRMGGSPIARLLPLALGGLVLLACLPVLVLGYIGADDNTSRLLRDRSEMAIDHVVYRISAHLEPPREQLSYIKAAVESGVIGSGPLGEAELGTFFFGALAATSQTVGIGHILPDRSMLRHNRSDLTRYEEDPSRVPNVDESLAAVQSDDAIQWLPAVWSEILQETILRLVAPLYGPDGEFKGAIVSPVTTSTLSRYLKELNDQGGPMAFILAGPNRVVAHPNMVAQEASAQMQGGKPLPGIDEIGDPVLAALWVEDRFPLTAHAPFRDAQGHWTWVGDEGYAYVYRTIAGYGAPAWTVGVYFPAEETRRERWTVNGIAIGGAALLCLALAAATIIGRRFGRPILDLAAAAERIEALDFSSVQDLPRGPIREVNRAAYAFERMAGGLRLFETYVPRALVRRLISSGSQRPESEIRTLTVLFMDLEGYTSFSAGRPATEIAEYLNAFLACIGPVIEADDGTIDNLMGDGVMAFWGAPEERGDHADAACRAGLDCAAAFSKLNAERSRAGMPSCRLRIGIHTGPVLVGNIGFEGRVHYTIIGEAVNIAQRIEQLGRDADDSATGDAIILVSDKIRQSTTLDFRFEAAFGQIDDSSQSAGPVFRLQ